MKLLILLSLMSAINLNKAFAEYCSREPSFEGNRSWAIRKSNEAKDSFNEAYEFKNNGRTSAEVCYGSKVQLYLWNTALEKTRESIKDWDNTVKNCIVTTMTDARPAKLRQEKLERTIINNINSEVEFNKNSCEAAARDDQAKIAAEEAKTRELAEARAEEARAAMRAIEEKEENARAEVRAVEAKRRNVPAKLIPAGNSSFIFTKEILIDIGKTTTSIGTESGNVKECIFIIPADETQQRRIKAGREFKIRDIETIDGDKAEIETSFSLEGTSATISCFANYPNNIKVGEVIDSLSASGVSLVLPAKLAEPVDI